MYYILDLTYFAVVNYLLNRVKERSITQNVTYKHTNTLGICRLLYAKAFLGSWCDRLFEQEIISLVDRLKCHAAMILVLRSYDRNVCHFREIKKLLSPYVASLIRQIEHILYIVSSYGIRICNRNKLHFRAMILSLAHVRRSASARTDKYKFKLLHCFSPSL